ncbi:MAG: hypothetical protein ABUS49_00160 [Acidobacteriota bacterium]
MAFYLESEGELLLSGFAAGFDSEEPEDESPEDEEEPESLFDLDSESVFPFSDDPPSDLDSPEPDSPDFESPGLGKDFPFPFA